MAHGFGSIQQEIRVERTAIYSQELCMKGAIRTKERCPKCGGKFTGEPLACPSCLTHPDKYYIVIYAPKRGTIKLYSDQRGEPMRSWDKAERVLTGIRNEIDQKAFDPTKHVKADVRKFLFETRIDAWYQDKLAEVESGNRSRGYAALLEYFIRAFYKPHFKTMDVREIRGFHIQEFYKKMPDKNKKVGVDKDGKKVEKKISLKHRKNIMDGLRAFFNDLKRQERIPSAPAFPVINIDRKTPMWIDLDTQIATLRLIPAQDRPIVIFLALQGTRPGEARALKVKDLDLKHGVIRVCRTFSGDELRERVKGKFERPRLINPALTELLADACRNKHPEAFVFTNQHGETYTKSQLWHIWDRARKSAGLKVNLYQATRHSVASIAVSNGVSVAAIKEVLGHTDIRTTMLYAHNDLSSQKEVFKKQSAAAGFLRLVTQQCPGEENEKEKAK